LCMAACSLSGSDKQSRLLASLGISRLAHTLIERGDQRMRAE
jgi:hypothetical protein